MVSSAFTAGNRPGGLTDEDQIRLLVCYLAGKRQNKLTTSDILETITSCGAANYFESADAVSDMLAKGHISESSDGTITITKTGENIINGMSDIIPASIRDNILVACDAYLRYKTNIGQHKVDITQIEGGYNVKCVIADLGTPVFSMELYAPTAEIAQHIKDRFVQFGAKLYGDALKILTE